MDAEVAQLPREASDEEAGNATEAEHVDTNDLMRRLLAAPPIERVLLQNKVSSSKDTYPSPLSRECEIKGKKQ